MHLARLDDVYDHDLSPSVARRGSRYTPQDPEQMHYRSLLSKLDEDELVYLESDIAYFLAGGPMSPSLSGMLDAGSETGRPSLRVAPG